MQLHGCNKLCKTRLVELLWCSRLLVVKRICTIYQIIRGMSVMVHYLWFLPSLPTKMSPHSLTWRQTFGRVYK